MAPMARCSAANSPSTPPSRAPSSTRAWRRCRVASSSSCMAMPAPTTAAATACSARSSTPMARSRWPSRGCRARSPATSTATTWRCSPTVAMWWCGGRPTTRSMASVSTAAVRRWAHSSRSARSIACPIRTTPASPRWATAALWWPGTATTASVAAPTMCSCSSSTPPATRSMAPRWSTAPSPARNTCPTSPASPAATLLLPGRVTTRRQTRRTATACSPRSWVRRVRSCARARPSWSMWSAASLSWRTRSTPARSSSMARCACRTLIRRTSPVANWW